MKLREFFRALPSKTLITGVEVGVKVGENAEVILSSLNMKKLILVDRWKAYDICDLVQEQIKMKYYDQRVIDEWKRVVLKKFKDNKKVEIICGTSVDVAKTMKDNIFDFVYIDAGHRYEDVLEDCKAWYRCIKKGGILGGHDYIHEDFAYGIKKATEEFASSINNHIRYEGEDWWIIK